MFFSIVIPIYNASKYLRRCIESIKKQTFTSYEIVLVDDGSTDTSIEIEMKYSIEMPNVRLVYSRNEGPAGARNIGIRVSKGQYIMFVDSDDTLESETLEHLFKVLNNTMADVCYMSQHFVIRENKKQLNIVFRDENQLKQQCYSREEFLRLVSKEKNDFPGSMWLIVGKREFIENNQIFLDNKIRWSEDTDFSYKLFSQANKIAVSQYAGYNWYTDDVSSVSHNVSISAIFNRLDVYKKWYLYFKSDSAKQFDLSAREKLAQKILFNYCVYLFQVGIFEDKSINEALSLRLKREKNIWSESDNWKVKIYQVIGIKMGIKINRIYNAFKRMIEDIWKR